MRPWTAEDVEKWGAGYIANQMNGFVQNIEKLRAECERMTRERIILSNEVARLTGDLYAAFEIMEDTQRHDDTPDDPSVGSRMRYWAQTTKSRLAGKGDK
jgi:hypothetical protein